jgi:hypothetical protein
MPRYNDRMSTISVVEVRPSGVHGSGVFARTLLPRGTVWWRARPSEVVMVRRQSYEILVTSHQSVLTQRFLEAVLHNGFYVAHYDAIVYITDNARFTNHSFDPSSMVCPKSDGLCSVTIRDVLPGEEIFEDYTQYDRCPWAHLWGEFGRALLSRSA